MSELTEVPGDIDATITYSTPEVQVGETPITDEMRDTMRVLVDPAVPNTELSFIQRKVAIHYGWLS